KGTKAKVIGQQRVVPDYEKKRWETLKKNAEFMKSKGHGTLAKRFFKKEQRLGRSMLKMKMNIQEKMMTMHLLLLLCSVVVCVLLLCCVVLLLLLCCSAVQLLLLLCSAVQLLLLCCSAVQLLLLLCSAVVLFCCSVVDVVLFCCSVVSKQKKSGSMSTFVKQLTPKQQSEQKQQQHLQTQQQLQKQHQPQLEKQQQELVHKKQQEQPDQKQKLLEKLRNSSSSKTTESTTFPKKQQDMRFCSPGSLSAYRNLRKKQVQNIEHPSNDEVEYGGQPMSINASGMVLEREAENEVQPMIETDNVAHERESETMIEGSSEEDGCWRLNLSWRGYKSKLKKMYLEAVEKGSNLDELYKLVPEDELKDLISYWNTSPAKEQSKKNKRNREKLDDMHTMGPVLMQHCAIS
ncbi:Ankyrin repeat domain-containing protein 17, partial [Bienertia sinuspersici]